MEGHERAGLHAPARLTGRAVPAEPAALATLAPATLLAPVADGPASRSGRRPLRTWLALIAVVVEATAAIAWLLSRALRHLSASWEARVEVAGPSMRPTLEPGDWVLVDPHAYRGRAPRAGELVLVPDPREPGRLLVKRVTGTTGDGRLHLTGDAPEASTDSRTFGPVLAREVAGRPWFRYWPPGRLARVR